MKQSLTQRISKPVSLVRLRQIACVLTLGIAVSSCSFSSILTPSPGPTPELKATLINVSGRYMGAIMKKDKLYVGNTVLWGEMLPYLSTTKSGFWHLVRSMNSKYPEANHPLLNVEVKGIEIKKDIAILTFESISNNEFPPFTITLRWAGSGWLITQDASLLLAQKN